MHTGTYIHALRLSHSHTVSHTHAHTHTHTHTIHNLQTGLKGAYSRGKRQHERAKHDRSVYCFKKRNILRFDGKKSRLDLLLGRKVKVVPCRGSEDGKGVGTNSGKSIYNVYHMTARQKKVQCRAVQSQPVHQGLDRGSIFCSNLLWIGMVDVCEWGELMAGCL